jgi:hypothetical protein
MDLDINTGGILGLKDSQSDSSLPRQPFFFN